MVAYVLLTAVMYIGLGYFLGRKLMYAPMPRMASVDSLEAADSMKGIEALISAQAALEDLAQGLNEPALAAFDAEKDLPKEWRELLSDVGECNSFVEASAHVLKLEVGRYRDTLMDIDERVRQCAQTLDVEMLQRAVDSLKAANEEWLVCQAHAADLLGRRKGTHGDLDSLGERLEAVLQSQVEQIENISGNIEIFDFQASPRIGARRLIMEIRKLVDSSHALRDCMHEMALAILTHENRLDKVDKRMLQDGLTGLRNRTGIESTIFGWWKDDQRRTRRVTVAMIDLDNFGRLTEQWGARLTDRVLAVLARMIDDMLRKYSGIDWCGRFAGQRFFIFWADTGPHGATSVIERIRQTVAKTTFEHAGGAIELSFSAAVTEVFPSDTTKTLFTRLNQTVEAAKKQGRNCSFLEEGMGPKMVQPPEFEVRGKIAPLDC